MKKDQKTRGMKFVVQMMIPIPTPPVGMILDVENQKENQMARQMARQMGKHRTLDQYLRAVTK